MYSYHVFYFPFKWEIKERENSLFAEQTNLDNIKWNPYSNWLYNPEVIDKKELDELYNEKNYYYEFVHPVLYDTGKENSILKHFERKEPKQRDVSYIISKRGGKTYKLKVDTINLNLYETGVGMLTFYLINEREDQKEPQDILYINQYGRRIFPPFIADIEWRNEIAQYIKIEGLNGEPSLFYEDFSGYTNKRPWKPACFINHLITDLYNGLEIRPVIDDRMYVTCWYANDNLSKKISGEFESFIYENNFWYNYLFVDRDEPTCQNENMRKELTDDSTYYRWQRYGILFGVSRYSFVGLMNKSSFSTDILFIHMRTIYSRMVELVLIQRASILRFSDEIASVGQLSKVKIIDKRLVERISSIYKEYIRFTNQIYFREVTSQDQGIELYKIMTDILKLQDYVDGLDKEIHELYQYVSLVDDKIRNRNAEKLNIIAAIFLPATLIAGLFGMNKGEDLGSFCWQFLIVVAATGIMFGLIQLIFKYKKK